ncbi:MAG: hypothetical protein ACREBG_18250 [Pyrinomonadaceae bacterium]
MKIWITTLLLLSFTVGAATVVTAQEDSSSATEEQRQKDKAEKEKRAFALLDQVVDEAQLLKLAENRARVQIGAADLLWQRNQGRARSLFALAADNVAEMMRTLNANPTLDARRGINQGRGAAQLRQELVLTVARYDAPLAYQLLAATRTTTPAVSTGNLPFADSEENLEQRLLAQIAALDPKLALQNAEQMLDKGQYPRSLLEVLARLQLKDKEAAAKLEDKMVKRLQSANMLSTFDAATLALSLLRFGPRPAENPPANASTAATNGSQVLAPTSYTGLMGSVIDAALKATPQQANTQRNANNVRNRRNVPGGGGAALNNATTPPTDAEVEQSNARRLLNSLQMLLPQIDQHLPARAQAVRQNMGELGMGNSPRANTAQIYRDIQHGTSESLLAAAPLAPPVLQPRIYQQAALRALDEGDAERARQIANDHLDEATRNSVLQAVEFRQTSEKIDSSKLEEVRRTLSGLRSDNERIDLLLQLSGTVQKNNPKLALQFLDEARQITNRRASNYQQFEQQLRVAEAFKDLEPARGFEVLEPGIAQLNELLSAAATLSGFEVNVFQDGELPLEGRNGLSNMVSRYGAVLGVLATMDFDQSQSLANRFQLSEPRIVAKLSIVRGMLGREPVGGARNLQFGPNAFIRRPGQ